LTLAVRPVRSPYNLVYQYTHIQEEQMSKGLASIMKQAQMIQQKMARLQEEASQKTAEATSGGGAVSVTVNGKNEIISLSIKKEAARPQRCGDASRPDCRCRQRKR